MEPNQYFIAFIWLITLPYLVWSIRFYRNSRSHQKMESGWLVEFGSHAHPNYHVAGLMITCNSRDACRFSRRSDAECVASWLNSELQSADMEPSARATFHQWTPL